MTIFLFVILCVLQVGLTLVWLVLRDILRAVKHQTMLDELDREERNASSQKNVLAGRR